jgi:uncharacterized lipoprotein NlpE involved in copper resistance
MVGRFLSALRPRRSPARKSRKTPNRVLRNESLEPRMLLSGSGFSSHLVGAAVAGAKVGAATPPTVVQPISINGNAPVSGRSAALSVLGSDPAGQTLVYIWSVAAAPAGGTATFSLNGSSGARNSVATFTEAGTYTLTAKIMDSSGLWVSTSRSVVVTPTLTSIRFSTPSGQVVNSCSSLLVSGVSQGLVAQELDQFGKVMSGSPALAWSAAALSAGASTPNLTGSAGGVTVTFAMAGSYGVTARLAGTTAVLFSSTLVVNQTLTRIVVSPNAATVQQGTTQQFTAQASDQFGKPMTGQQTFTWSSGGGTISASGLFTAPSNLTSCTITARSGTVTGTAAVTITKPSTPPTVTQPISVNGGSAAVTGTGGSLSVLGSDPAGQTLVYTWSVTAAPAGGSATFSLNGTNGAKSTVVTFTEAGTYTLSVTIVDSGGLSVTTSKSVVVTPTLTSVRVSTAAGQFNSGSSLNTWGVSQALVAQGFDQFGNAMSGSPTLAWSTTSLPAGAAAPSFATGAGGTTVTFAMAGYYTVTARAASSTGVLFTGTIIVNQTLTRISLSPNAPCVVQGTTQQFTAQALDQFGKPMANQQIFTWSSSGGTISATGLFTAPGSGSGCTVTATSGSLAGTATVTILANSGGLQDPALGALVQSLDADGSVSRLDMIQILRSVAANGQLDAADFSDLKKILSEAATLNMPAYVQALAGDIINGNLANATFQGQAMGNLAVGSSATVLNDLISKWFFGADHPVLCDSSLTYQTVAGSLFPQTPSHADEDQGYLGDCYFISALGTLADSNPAAIQNMFINNGDGTYTVRFYTGTYGVMYGQSGGISAGFTNGVGTADYITVDSMLPVTAWGTLAYADCGASDTNAMNSLWIPLAEKAYAQWNQTGKEGRDDTNSYQSIQGGWMATVDAQVLGHNATDYIMTTTSQQVAINALAAHEAVTIGTGSWSGTQDGLYANHAYAIIGYTINASNPAMDTFTLYNPWGPNPAWQPGPLTWSQLQADTTQLAVANASGSVPMSGVPTGVQTGVGSVAGPALGRLGGAAAAWLSASAAATPARSSVFSAAAGPSPELFGDSSGAPHAHQASAATAAPGSLSALEVDALFAAG